jgi:hypothetical protein
VAHPLVDPDVARRLAPAVYATLRHADLETLHDLETVATLHASRYGVPSRTGEVALLSRAAAESDPVREAISGTRSWRGVPLSSVVVGTTLEGEADLVYEKSDGTLGVVEFEMGDTAGPPVPLAARTARCGAAGGAYALMLEQATGKRVSSVAFVSVDGAATPVTYHAGQVDQLLAATARALRAPLPARPPATTGRTGAASTAPVADLDLF